ncbi:MAG: nucleotide pyrophosphohydrolase [Candidatus Pacebacteria bacterium]|nr:nucleotide pyrophosphohydrolase [Candidatus Paceibacterota bacterium]PIR59610.1 MAG: nucleotide pyrophosphohydrolase [Candidatus Pacebacteria bacterium CG10_big_fil_rev_8_21_14_0_10_45_6]
MSDIQDLTKQIIKFRDQRDWKQFHTPKDLVISLLLELSELAEHFQWKNEQELTAYLRSHKQEIGEELADVFYWVLLMANDFGIDVSEALRRKLIINEKKYPISKAKGKHTKYSRL